MPDAYPWLRDQLARFTYRPSSTLEIMPSGGWHGVHDYSLVVTMRVEDTYNPGRFTPVVSRQPVPPYLSDGDSSFLSEDHQRRELEFAKWLQRALLDVEQHESREWLRRDGEIYDDPHEEKR